MGMDLQNKNDEWFQCRGMAWRITLMLADSYGWQRAGTLPPLDENGEEPQGVHLIARQQPARFLSWLSYFARRLTGRASSYWDTSNYGSNDGQRVTDEDARALADVLTKVRDEIKGTEIEKQFIGGDSEEWFTDFITYFRKGGFSIN